MDDVNTGQNTPFLLSSAGITRIEGTEGASLGTAENLHYGSGKILLNPNDKLFLFNKGLTGAVNAEGTAFGEMKLESFLGKSHHFPVETIVRETINEVFTFMADTPLPD